ncbi:N-acetylmuramoyl-L-alanine amidase [Haloimpatiens sp. FM7315]|uniref:N-acetylmuramoyl-L-alanine amidase family protein n=1 Tax=Haloimpatiens sp. FM7315 TaxID=3298609 RepID=UPI00370BCE32
MRNTKKKVMPLIILCTLSLLSFFYYNYSKQKNMATVPKTEKKSSAIKNNKAKDSSKWKDKGKTEEEIKSEEKSKAEEKSKVKEKSENSAIKSEKEDAKVSKAAKKVVVIDPGHANRSNLSKEPLAPNSNEMKIKDGGGAAGVTTKTPEYKINMQVSLELKSFLEKKGYIVKLTKTKDSESLGNVERAKIGNDYNAALVIRIHADSSNNREAKGASMLVPAPINTNTKKIYEKSNSYGNTILTSLVTEVGMKNRGVIQRNDMTGFNWSQVPVVLVEMGFLSNTGEEKLLCSKDYQIKIANALSNGIDKALR